MKPKFQVLILGSSGGPRETDLSGYLLSPLQKHEWIALDAGSLLAGLEIAWKRKNLFDIPLKDSNFLPTKEVLKQIKAYLISHAHLDHISGLVINSQIDAPKSILGIDSTIDHIRDHIFNGKIWANYGNEGANPLSIYHYERLALKTKTLIPYTSLTVEAFPLCHPGDYLSSAFLIEHQNHYILYLGDTSSDEVEKHHYLTQLWDRVGPLIQHNLLHAIFLECSYPHNPTRNDLFGHLDTKLMMLELHRLSSIAGSNLEGLKIIVTHRKESLTMGFDDKERITEELTSINDLAFQFIFPSQGEKLIL